MKIIEASAGLLTNFEVLDFLRNKGDSHSPVDEKISEIKIGDAEAGDDDGKIKCSLTPSERKVYDYLVNTAARDQTRDCVIEFLQRCRVFELTQADVLPILNLRPSTPSASVELYSIVESFFERYESQADEIVQMIDDMLPPRPIAKKDEEELVPLEMVNLDEGKVVTKPQQASPHPEPEPEPMIES